MIKEYIEAKYGFKVHTAYIAETVYFLGCYDGVGYLKKEGII